MSCEGCDTGPKAIQQALANIQKQAKDYAVENDTNVFIYQTPDGWDYMAEEKARELGIQPTGGVVSKLRPAASDQVH